MATLIRTRAKGAGCQNRKMNGVITANSAKAEHPTQVAASKPSRRHIAIPLCLAIICLRPGLEFNREIHICDRKSTNVAKRAHNWVALECPQSIASAAILAPQPDSPLLI
jgi:hypothetical protein